jgi:hypothetical protein
MLKEDNRFLKHARSGGTVNKYGCALMLDV